MTTPASDAEVGLMEIDVGDAAMFSVEVSPFGVDTAMTATITPEGGTPVAFTMTPNADKSVWTGTSPILSASGDYTATFTTAGTGAGVQHHTVIVAVPPPLTSDLKYLRLLIPDTDPENRLFRLDELQLLLDRKGGNVEVAAAQALGIIASSEAMISKVLRKDDMATDGARVGAELRARAQQLLDQQSIGQESGLPCWQFPVAPPPTSTMAEAEGDPL